MTPLLLQAAGASACAVLWMVWILYRRFFALTGLNNIPGPPSASWLNGNLTQFFNRHGWNFHRELADKYGPVVAINGWFGKKMLYVFDPKALHNIVVKEQSAYEETAEFLIANRLILGEGLLATLGDHHRQQRKILNPVFSINHMRYMLPIFYSVTHRLRDALMSRVNDGQKTEVDVLHWMSRTALELVGQGGMGVSFDPLVEDVVNPYAEALKSIPTTFFPMYILRFTLPYIYNYVPSWVLVPLMKILPYKRLQHARYISKTLERVAGDVLASKKAAFARGDQAVTQQVGEGKDILSVLMQQNMKAKDDDRMPEHEMIGHMTTLIFAATDTTSSALSRILYMLAKHTEAQDKLRRELRDARVDGQELSYDDLVALPYLDAVCRETLRLFAPVPYMSRITRKDTILPLSSPIRGKNGQMIDEIHIPNDTTLFVSILSANRNKMIWGEDAHGWKPERWLSPLPDSVTDAHIPGIYSNLMTFLGGGRACIGFKFSQLEMKVVLSTLVETFTFELPPDKDIYWNFSGILYPTVGPIDSSLQMPMRVGLVKQ